MGEPTTQQADQLPSSALSGPPVDPAFERALDDLIAVASQGQQPTSQFFNPSDEWLINQMRIFQDLPEQEQRQIRREWSRIGQQAEQANAQGRAAERAGPDVVFRLNTGGLAFFSQLGVARRPDLTQYFIKDFPKNRDALPFSEANQALFAEVLPYATARIKEHFTSGDSVIQTDRQIGDAPGRSFHARQLLYGTRYLQIPYMWRQLTFDLSEADSLKRPDILEISIPNWLDDLGLPEDLKHRIVEAGLPQLVFKAPSKGLSLHLGFDYVGEHKMGPLSVAMFKLKQAKGLAIQAALSLARVTTLQGKLLNTTLVTVGPSLHGKSTLTIMLELAQSALSKWLGLTNDPEEGIFPMNDDIVLLQPLPQAAENTRGVGRGRIPYGIDGTENNFYAVPFGLTPEDDPITYHVVRGTKEAPNPQETLENVPINLDDGTPDFLHNPVRNMRMILSRPSLIARKGVQPLLQAITNGRTRDGVHVPMEDIDRVFWQAVMRQNTVIPPLRRVTLRQYVRVLMYGEAVQMGAAAGAIGRPYVEYFSDPFIIGLEDENANALHRILQEMARGGLLQEYYVFNTGGLGAETNEEASGPRYKKIPRELTLLLQEALLRGAVKFEHDTFLGSDVAVAVVNALGEEVVDLRTQWLPRAIYGEEEYGKRVLELKRRRFYGQDAGDRAGILRYTKVTDALLDIEAIPPPRNERELASLLCFYWHVDQTYSALPELVRHLGEGQRPASKTLQGLQQRYQAGLAQGLELPPDSFSALGTLGIGG